jgi:hypothetical protein
MIERRKGLLLDPFVAAVAVFMMNLDCQQQRHRAVLIGFAAVSFSADPSRCIGDDASAVFRLRCPSFLGFVNPFVRRSN